SWGPVVADRNYRRHVGEHRKKLTYSEEDTRAKNKKQDSIITLLGTPPDSEAMAIAASSAAAARVNGVGGGGGGGGGRGGGGSPPIPVMLGVNADEGVMFVHGAFPVTMPRLVYHSFVMALFRSSVVGVLRAYGDVADQCAESGDYRRVMSHIMHDYLFRCPNLRAAQLLQ
ncbi:unnamed protein product, partial [Laminaria digitata]